MQQGSAMKQHVRLNISYGRKHRAALLFFPPPEAFDAVSPLAIKYVPARHEKNRAEHHVRPVFTAVRRKRRRHEVAGLPPETS
jgi:hypothetical protein